MDISTKKKYLARINKLTPMHVNAKDRLVTPRAICGDYGIIECHHSAEVDVYNKRIFKVIGSKKLRNGGVWTYAGLRKAIMDV